LPSWQQEKQDYHALVVLLLIVAISVSNIVVSQKRLLFDKYTASSSIDTSAESSTRASSKAISQVQPTNTTSTNAQDRQEQVLPPAAPESQEEGVLPTININEEKIKNKKAKQQNEAEKMSY